MKISEKISILLDSRDRIIKDHEFAANVLREEVFHMVQWLEDQLAISSKVSLEGLAEAYSNTRNRMSLEKKENNNQPDPSQKA